MEKANTLFTFLSVGNALDRTFSIYMSRWQLFTQLALIVAIPQIILSIVLQKTLLAVDPETAEAAAAEAAAEGAAGFPTVSTQQIIALVIQVPFSFLFGIIIQAAVIHIVAEYYTHKDSTFRGSLVHAIDRFCSIFGFGLLYTAAWLLFSMVVGALIGFLFAIQAPQFFMLLAASVAFSFAIYVMLSLTIVLPVLVIEKQSPIGAMKRSFELLPTYRCYVFCSMFLLALVVVFGSILYQVVVQAIFGTSIWGSAVSGLSAVVTLPLQTM